jgi:hypothetical protein
MWHALLTDITVDATTNKTPVARSELQNAKTARGLFMGIDEIAPPQPPAPVPPPAPQTAHSLPLPRDGISLWKDLTATVQSIATVLALCVAGWWFLRQGTAAPHANLTHVIQSVKIHDQWRLVRLSVRVANVGVVPISLDSAKVYLARVLPLEDSIKKMIDGGDSPISAASGEIAWPSIGDPYKFDPQAEILPGESETYNFDFLVPTNLCEVMLHSRFSSTARKDLDWSESTLQKVGDCDVN